MLNISALTASFDGKNHLLQNVSFSVEKGEVLAIFGPSGCGKSTLMNAIAGFIDYRATSGARFSPFPRKWFSGQRRLLLDTGNIFIDGVDVSEIVPEKRPISFVFQRFGTYPHMTGVENISFPLRCQQLPRAEIDRIVARAAGLTGLSSHHLTSKVGKLSGGEAQRVAIAKMLAKRAPVSLMDEPFSHLDQHNRLELLKLIRQLVGSADALAPSAAVIVSHDWREAKFADKVLLLNATSNGSASARLFRRIDSETIDFNHFDTVPVSDSLEASWIEGLKAATAAQ